MRADQHQRLITLALAVLKEAVAYSSREAVATPGVRLALRVLLPYVVDRRGLLLFWERAQARAPHPWETCHEPLNLIALTLRRNGWDAPA